MNNHTKKDPLLPVIWGLSIVIPIVVAVLLTPGLVPTLPLGDTSFLPKLNAMINSSVSVLLVIGYICIRNKKIQLHKMAMLGAFFLSAAFLVSYVLYHLSKTGHTSYCDAVIVPAIVYYFVLFSHIFLSIFIVPLALFSIYRGWNEQFDQHRNIAKITFPLWLYVSVTGVLVYLFISPCY